jgi:hypothetical protein
MTTLPPAQPEPSDATPTAVINLNGAPQPVSWSNAVLVSTTYFGLPPRTVSLDAPVTQVAVHAATAAHTYHHTNNCRCCRILGTLNTLVYRPPARIACIIAAPKIFYVLLALLDQPPALAPYATGALPITALIVYTVLLISIAVAVQHHRHMREEMWLRVTTAERNLRHP